MKIQCPGLQHKPMCDRKCNKKGAPNKPGVWSLQARMHLTTSRRVKRVQGWRITRASAESASGTDLERERTSKSAHTRPHYQYSRKQTYCKSATQKEKNGFGDF